jgi:hypothetical protein
MFGYRIIVGISNLGGHLVFRMSDN